MKENVFIIIIIIINGLHNAYDSLYTPWNDYLQHLTRI